MLKSIYLLAKNVATGFEYPLDRGVNFWLELMIISQ
jgi:hypothetical protein